MEWLIQLQGQIVGLDTAPLIYFIEQNKLSIRELIRNFDQIQGDFSHNLSSWIPIFCQFVASHTENNWDFDLILIDVNR